MSAYSDLIPVNVLTGALGSGKTTLLKALLRAPRLAGTMVLVNELGEIGIDHHLVEHASESTLLLENGCLCCAMRDDLKAALKDLHSRRARGEIPRYERIVVETTGIADPVPIAYTLLAEPVLQHHYRLGNVVTVVDAVNAPAQLDRFEEAVRQVALADRLVASKLDLAGPASLEALRPRLAALNPTAPILAADSPDLDPVDLLVTDVYHRRSKGREVERWMRSARGAMAADDGPAGGVHGPHPASDAFHAAGTHGPHSADGHGLHLANGHGLAGEASAFRRDTPFPEGGLDPHPANGHDPHPANGHDPHPAGGHDPNPANGHDLAGGMPVSRRDTPFPGGGHGPHPTGIAACCFTFDAALDWTAFGVWMSMLLHRHGDRVLRMKGLLNVAGVPGPVLVNGVQHLVHPPAHLDRWPDEDRRSRVVVISNGLGREEIEHSLHAFNAIANPAPTRADTARGST